MNRSLTKTDDRRICRRECVGIYGRVCGAERLASSPRYNPGMHLHTRRELLAGSTLALLARRLGALPLSQIKLGVTTDEIDDDVLTAAKYLHEHGLQWAEVRNIWGPY